jgi:hypothetical protein
MERFLSELDSMGNKLWTIFIGSNGSDSANCIAVSSIHIYS